MFASLSLEAKSFYQACRNRLQVFWMRGKSYILALLWDLQISTQHCNVSHYHTKLHGTISACCITLCYICSDVPSDTYQATLDSPSLWRRALLLGQEKRGQSSIPMVFRKRRLFSVPLCNLGWNHSRVLGAPSPFVVSALLLMCLSLRDDKILQKFVSLDIHPGMAKSSERSSVSFSFQRDMEYHYLNSAPSKYFCSQQILHSQH